MSETSSTTTASQGGSSSGPLPSGAEVLTAWLKHAAYVRVDGRKYLVLESVPFDDLDTGLAYEELVHHLRSWTCRSPTQQAQH